MRPQVFLMYRGVDGNISGGASVTVPPPPKEVQTRRRARLLLTSRQHLSWRFLRFFHLIAAVFLLRLVLRASIVLFEGLEEEPILKKYDAEKPTRSLKQFLLVECFDTKVQQHFARY